MSGEQEYSCKRCGTDYEVEGGLQNPGCPECRGRPDGEEWMNDITLRKPLVLGYYKIALRRGSPLHKLYGMDVITARYIERDAKNGTHRFFDLPRPNEGVAGWALVEEN